MSAIDELKSISTKKHVVTSIEYDCPSQEKEDEVFDMVQGILKHHLDEVAKITYDLEADDEEIRIDYQNKEEEVVPLTDGGDLLLIPMK